jgi:hypothetical protein
LKRRFVLLLLVTVCSLALLAAGCSGSETSSQDGDTIKIGFLGGKTGNHAHYGIETLKGMEMAVEKINSATFSQNVYSAGIGDVNKMEMIMFNLPLFPDRLRSHLGRFAPQRGYLLRSFVHN